MIDLPRITIIDQNGDGTDLDTANVEDLADSYTASELAVMSALLSVAAHKVSTAQHRLHQQQTPQPVHPLPFI